MIDVCLRQLVTTEQVVQNQAADREEDDEQCPEKFAAKLAPLVAQQVDERHDVEHDDKGAADAPVGCAHALKQVRAAASHKQQRGDNEQADTKERARAME